MVSFKMSDSENFPNTKGMAIHDLNLAARYTDRVIMMNGGHIYAAGVPSAVLTPENINHAYGVEVEVINHKGRLYVLPIRPVGK